MSSNQNKTLNCTGEDAENELCKVMDEKLIKQFKIMIVVVFIILLIFLGLFVYNLIKCYLPKWKKKKMVEEVRQVEIQNSQSK